MYKVYSMVQITLIIIICIVVAFLVAYGKDIGSDMLYVIRVKRATVRHEKKLKKENQERMKK